MSYNIDTWNTKEILCLKIPLTAIQEIEDTTIKIFNGGNVSVDGPAEVFEITGKLTDGIVGVESIAVCGEGSGRAWNSLIELLKQSTGELVAIQVWEGGDSISRLTVVSGEVREQQIEI